MQHVSHNTMEAGAYLPRPVVVSMMLKTHMKRGFWPAAGRIALRERRLAGGSVLADSSGGRAAPARASCSEAWQPDRGVWSGRGRAATTGTGSCVRWIPRGRAKFGQVELAKRQGPTGNLGRGLDGLNF
jgi:hypothetical protein